MRGKADYVCYAGRRMAWTIEAKPEVPELTTDDVEQAYTYARHPEVRAEYFCLCNGKEFRVNATSAAAGAPPLRITDPREPATAAVTLRSLLGPEELLRRFADVVADASPPIGEGLASFAQITGGRIVYDLDVPLRALQGITMGVATGAIQRDESNRLYAYWKVQAPYAQLQRTLTILKLDTVEAHSDQSQLSVDPSRPTVFILDETKTFPKGTPMFDLASLREMVMPLNMHARVRATSSGVLIGDRFRGRLKLECALVIEDEMGQHARAGDFCANASFEFSPR